MARAKLFALIGNILLTITFIMQAISAFQMISSTSAIKKSLGIAGNMVSQKQISQFVIISIFVQLVLFIIFVLSWIAFIKIGKKSERAWKTFLLVIGILGCFNIFTLIGNPVASLISVIGSIMFILAFTSKVPKLEDKEDFQD
ncbi:MAG: hypothetical protein LBI13_10275 [Streptococcaceae bacterium]|jgi:hypothetical protein|nr:hypothetical protein [Streptococcaceae bacterium]